MLKVLPSDQLIETLIKIYVKLIIEITICQYSLIQKLLKLKSQVQQHEFLIFGFMLSKTWSF